jgi:hypothetical protein
VSRRPPSRSASPERTSHARARRRRSTGRTRCARVARRGAPRGRPEPRPPPEQPGEARPIEARRLGSAWEPVTTPTLGFLRGHEGATPRAAPKKSVALTKHEHTPSNPRRGYAPLRTKYAAKGTLLAAAPDSGSGTGGRQGATNRPLDKSSYYDHNRPGMRRGLALFAVAFATAGVLSVSAGATKGVRASWVTTRTAAQHGLKDRFANIASVSCTPDRSSATLLHGNTRYWQRFWCQGRTYGAISFRLRFKATGQCSRCWTITNLTGTGATQLRTKATPTRGPATGSCPSDYYKNSSGHCIHRPSSNPAGATAVCADGTYSYSEHASGTCSHHGGVARWINHP